MIAELAADNRYLTTALREAEAAAGPAALPVSRGGREMLLAENEPNNDLPWCQR